MAVKGFRLKVDSGQVKALLQSVEVASELERRGEAIAEAAGGRPDFEVRNTRNRDRAVTFVTTATIEGMREEASHRSLTRAVDAGR